MASAGGVVYLLDGSGRSFTPFESSAAAVPLQLAQDGDRIWIGAGVGGGPRLQSRDYRTLAVLSDEFLGDPASRTGVSVAVFQPYRSPLQVESHPLLPGDTAGVQQQVDELPPGLAAWLAADNYRVIVFGGQSVTQLPEFAWLAGQETPQAGDGGRTYDQVPAVGLRSAAYLSTGAVAATLHEIGHGVWFRLSAEERSAWVAVWSAVEWSDPYLRGNSAEGFAEAFSWWVRAGRDTGGYFERLFAASTPGHGA
jgi:hypothetical protein